jgi:hypothetical protein
LSRGYGLNRSNPFEVLLLRERAWLRLFPQLMAVTPEQITVGKNHRLDAPFALNRNSLSRATVHAAVAALDHVIPDVATWAAKGMP